jgi:hypothetical protein
LEKHFDPHLSSLETRLGSVQMIKNPFNENLESPSYIIVIFGLGRNGTQEAAKKFITLCKNDFEELQRRKFAMFTYDRNTKTLL